MTLKRKKKQQRGKRKPKPVAVFREVCWVPEVFVKPFARKAYEYLIHPNPRACDACEDQTLCAECRFAPRVHRSYVIREGRIPLFGFPLGNRKKLKRILRRLGIVRAKDKRARPKLPAEMVFTGKLRRYQKEAVGQWLKKRYGVLLAPARSGKTVMAVYIATMLGLKTLILAHREDLLIQFEKSFRRFTDLNEVERFYGKPFILRSSHRAFAKAPIGLATFQHFIKHPQRIRELRDNYGLVIVDECHHVPAKWFKTITQGFAPRYRLGLTATPERKDSLEVILFDVMGPVTAVAEPPTLKAAVQVIKTGRKVKQFYHWTTFLSRLARDRVRNKMIVKYIKRDLDRGRSVLVVVWRRFHVKELAKLLDKEGIPYVELHGDVSPQRRAENLDRARQRDVRVTIATRGVVQEGIDCPAWDTLYWTTPLANESGIYQEVSRIRTPAKGKKKPLVRYFLDDVRAAYSCYKVATRVFNREGFAFKAPITEVRKHAPLAKRRVIQVED